MTINFNDVTDTATPTTGAFNVGGNATVNGTGMNLVTYSQAVGNASLGWGNVGTASATQNSAVAPDSTTTASTITGASNIAYNTNNTVTAVFVSPSTLYTFSCYVKFGTATTVSIGFRDNSSGAEFSTATTTASGWTRISISATSGSSTTSVNLVLGGANGTFFAWGAQANTGATATAYVATSGAITLGNPFLAVGTALLGVTSTGSLYLQPSGTNAIQAQNTTSTTTGGNARGANAVDFQMVRSAAGQVASSSNSFIGSGRYNTANGGDASVLGGYGNLASGTRATVVGGESNTSSGNNCYVGAGYQNTAAGNLNVIGGGQGNSGTAQAAITTQTAATTSGSTAVTLSGSNANIKVGQWVEGTGINNYTYVSAVSGTSLTLTANATATNAAITLTFRTPFGTVVGGGNNQATGSYSFIGGGGDAGTSSNRNVASGDWSFVGGGTKNTASGIGSFVGGGGTNGSSVFPNTASNAGAVVVGGFSNSASGFGASVLGGNSNSANGSYSAVISGLGATNRGIAGALNFNASIASVAGDAQCGIYTLRKSTTDATPSIVTTDAGAAGTTNQVILPNNAAYYFKGEIISGVTGGGDSKGWEISGVIKRGAGVGTTTLVGSTVTSLYADAGAVTWTIALSADTTNGGLAITVTGQASTTIRWVAQVRTTEMTF